MRLLYTIPDYWPNVRRGSERVAHELAECMRHEGHTVSVLTRAAEGEPSRAADDGGVSVRYRATHPRVTRALGLADMEAFAIPTARAALTRPASVHHAFYISDAYALTQAARLRPRPVVFNVTGTPDRRWWEANHPRLARWMEVALRRADRVLVNSENAAAAMRADYALEPQVLPPGIFTGDYAGPRRDGGPPTVLCAAAVDDPRKRLDLLVDAFAILARRDRAVTLRIAGQGDPGAVLARASGHGAATAGRVEVLPATEAMAPLYAAATVAALTSHRESFGLVVVEAMAAGVPAVVPDDGGSAELVTPGTGVVFRAGDAEACAAALGAALELAADPGTEARCRARAAAFDWSHLAPRYDALYRELAA